MTISTHFTKTSRKAMALLGAVLGASLVLAGCSRPDAPSDQAPTSPAAAVDNVDMLTDHGLDGLDARGIIEHLDTMALAERPNNLIASIRPDELLLTDDQQRETTIAMPEDEFYVSFAPYVSQTHDCHFHSLTTCVGELQNADVQVTVTDEASGETLVDEALTTYDNGFLGVWLPRDIDGTLTVEYEGLTAEWPITTKGEDAATCVTTLPLT